jgi:hypothetical protein
MLFTSVKEKVFFSMFNECVVLSTGHFQKEEYIG